MRTINGENEQHSYLGYGTVDLKGGASALGEGPPYTVSGVAIPDNAETKHANGEKVWTPDALRQVADTLADDSYSDQLLGDGNAVIDHSTSASDSIGRIKKSGYVDGIGVVFEADLSNRNIAESVLNDELEVSPRTIHADDELLDTDDDGRYILDGGDVKRFVHLSFEQSGRAPGNFVETGPSEALADMSAADLSASLRKGEPVARSDLASDGDEGGSGGSSGRGAEIHRPSWQSKSESGDWSAPSMDDFDTDDLSQIGEHFVVSTTGFPADNYGDLKLPVVSPDGTLYKAAVDNAKARLGSVEGISGEAESRAETTLNGLQDEFDGSGSGSNGGSGSDSDGGSQQTDNSPPEAAKRLADAGVRLAHRVAEPGGVTTEDLAAEPGASDDPENHAASTPVGTETQLFGDGSSAAEANNDETRNMTDVNELAEDIEEYSEPVVIESDELTDLRAAKNQRNEDLEGKVEDLRGEVDDLEDENDVLSDKNSKLEDEVEDLRGQVETFAGPVVEDLAAELGLEENVVLDRFSADEIITMAENQGTTLPDDTPSPRGGDPGGGGGEKDEERTDLSAEEQETLDELETKLATAKETDMQGMVDHYEGQIEDLRAGVGGD